MNRKENACMEKLRYSFESNHSAIGIVREKSVTGDFREQTDFLVLYSFQFCLLNEGKYLLLVTFH